MVADESSLLRVLMAGLSSDESTKMTSALNEATLSTEPERHRRSPTMRRRRPRPVPPVVRQARDQDGVASTG
ncbi:MAG: hypothetical protein NVSMB13_08240 [Mycobacteriales bacterium]